jgi:hypothetical protein
MLVLCDDQILSLSVQREIADMGGLRGALAAQKSVKDEAEAFLKEKSSAELLTLKIDSLIAAGSAASAPTGPVVP